MTPSSLLLPAFSLLPALLMLAALPHGQAANATPAWGRFHGLALAALLCTLASLGLQLLASWDSAGAALSELAGSTGMTGVLATTLTGAWLAVLVQLLGTVIGAFSARYLQGEPGQVRYVAALGAVLAAVHLLLLANHWLVLIGAWAAVGLALRHLLCFYGDRPFARLAAHKKHMADRLADLLLLAAAAMAWHEVGSGSLSALWAHLEAKGEVSWPLQASALCLALAVVLRSALLPVHGWLLQVMEAPTPVSALLHAGVVNLGGFVLIRFAPLLDMAPLARWLLVGLGLATAVLAGLVMLTRISIKLRLAWSTVAQMGFMLMQCGLGLYALALLHLIGHSLYKAHAFLAASTAVEHTRLRMMRGATALSTASLLVAPALSATVVAAVVALVTTLTPLSAWPWWWSGVLALAWAPLLWLPGQRQADATGAALGLFSGVAMVAGLVLAALLGHALPFGVRDTPLPAAGLLVLAGLAVLYGCLALLQARPHALARWRRWAYAGFYVDEYLTRASLRWWPTRWATSATD